MSSLSEYIKLLDADKDLVRVKTFVDPVLQIAEITDRFSKSENGGKAILFENTGTGIAVLTNIMGSQERMENVLRMKNGSGNLNEILNKLELSRQGGGSFLGKIRVLPFLYSMSRLFPKLKRGKGECQEIVDLAPDLKQLPILKCWPHDGGAFITLPMVITKNPETKTRNVGMYRMQVLDAQTTGMHWHRHKTGARHFEMYKAKDKKMPVAVALGGDPLLTYCATAPLPDGIDEFLFAGIIRNKKVEMVKCITQDLEVPAEADIVIEGYVNPAEDFCWEGPFGDHTGFYSLPDYYPKFHVTCITRRKNAVYPATIVGVPPMEDAWIGEATANVFLLPVKYAICPEIIDLHLPVAGVAHNLVMVSIKKEYPAQAFKVASALFGAGQMMFSKYIMVCDADENLKNYPEVFFHALSRLNFKTDVMFFHGPLDVLDHSSSRALMGSKVCFDLTRKMTGEMETEIVVSEFKADGLNESINLEKYPFVKEVNYALTEKGIPCIVMSVEKSIEQEWMQILARHSWNGIKMVLVFDKETNVFDLFQLSWFALSNTDPERDFVFAGDGDKSTLLVNATRKAGDFGFERPWPAVVCMDKKTIEEVDALWDERVFGLFLRSPSLGVQNMYTSHYIWE